MNKCNATIKNFRNGNPLSPIVLSSPHSGNFYPKEFENLSQIPNEIIRQSEDSLVDHLLLTNHESENVLLSAIWSRGVVDVNRSINGLGVTTKGDIIGYYKKNP